VTVSQPIRQIRDEKSWDRWLHDVLGPASDHLMEPLLDRIDEILRHESQADPFQRDPELLELLLPLMHAVRLYFGGEVRGFENLPEGKPTLIVGNHSGGMMTFDPFHLMLEWAHARGLESPLYALSYDLLFAFPGMGPFFRKLGCLPASHENARRALDRGASVVVFPGGDYEVFRPWVDRNRIRFGHRMGFIALALTTGASVVPMTIHGAHESTLVLTRGHRLAGRLGLDRLRVKVFPILWNFPFGVAPAFVPTLPLPSKVTVQLGEPMDWGHLGPEDAENPEVLQRCYEELTGCMQETLDGLTEERPYPILSRLNDMRPSRIARRAISRFSRGAGPN
jgi:1-acyl-sn-glycerol-3-phosphate acyltransferase